MRFALGPTAALLLFLAAACTRTAPVLAPAGPVLLTVLTWNMGGGRGDLPRLVNDIAAGALGGGPPGDYILLLQEAPEGDEGGLRAVAASHQLSLQFETVRRGRLRATGNAILSTAPLLDARAIALPRERQPRAAVVADVVIQGERLFVVSTHLENRLGWMRGLFGDRARGRQAEALLRGLPPARPGILGGDMNTMLGVNEPAWEAFFRRFPDTPPDPEPTFRERLVLDHLFFDLPQGWTTTRRVLADDYGSDHRPVVGVIRSMGN